MHEVISTYRAPAAVIVGFVPEPSRFFESLLVCTPNPELRTDVPHFRAYYQAEIAVLQKQRRLVEAWAESHQVELLADWALLRAGRKAAPFEPLK
jgi:hypothetical protein